MTTPMIDIDTVTKYFGEKLVLDRVSLRIAPHEVVYLIGASGSGKSTLLRCVNRLVAHDYGTIRHSLLCAGREPLRCRWIQSKR